MKNIRFTSIFIALLWLVTIGHCMAESGHCHTDPNQNTNHHHHGDSNEHSDHHDSSDNHGAGSHSETCELKAFVPTSSTIKIEALKIILQAPFLSCIHFLLNDQQSADPKDLKSYLLPAVEDPPSKILVTTLLAPNSPPYAA